LEDPQTGLKVIRRLKDKMEEETTNNEDKEVYFEDMVDDTPELEFEGYGLGVPHTKFTNRSIWD
jgi:hypothetical protein